MALKNIGILLFDDVELLDFAGPVQVFSSFKYMYPEDCDSVITIGLTDQIKVSKLGMIITPDVTIDKFDHSLDLFIIPGGFGTRPLIKDEASLKKIDHLAVKSHINASVCTGSLVLAKLKKLSHLQATTHFAATDILTKLDPTIIVDRSKRYHDHGQIIVSEGVSAGIDMSFHLLNREYGTEKSNQVRKYIEYYPEKS